MIPRSRAKAADSVDASNDIASSEGGIGLADVRESFRVTEDVERLFQLSEIFEADENRSRVAVAGDDDALVLALDAVDELKKMVAD